MASIPMAQEQSQPELISSFNEHAEELAASGDWDAVSDVLAKRNAVLRELADDEKEEALRASIRSTARIRALVEKAKDTTGRELGQLQRGKEATESYNAYT